MTPTDADLVLYADNALSSERKQLLLQAAKNDVNIAKMLSALDSSRLPFKAAFEFQTLPPVPDKLRDSLHDLRRHVFTGSVTSADWDR